MKSVLQIDLRTRPAAFDADVPADTKRSLIRGPDGPAVVRGDSKCLVTRRVLPPSDLGGISTCGPAAPDRVAALAKTLGPIASRSSPIRDAILLYLSEPRRAADIAVHIQRPVPIPTGHLAAMRRRGLVKRIGRATYALASYAGRSVHLGHRTHKRDELRRRLTDLLVNRRSLEDLCVETEQTLVPVLAALRAMWLSGLVYGDRVDGYQLISAIRAE